MPIQARTEFAAALNQLASEKGVDVAVILEAIQQAALAAYRKDLSLRGEDIPEDFEELIAKINPASGEISIYRGQENITPPGFARIAAQTAKQVIMQRLHEAEKTAITDEYEKKVGTVISGMIQRQEGNTYFVDLGRAEGVFPLNEQTRGEYYHLNQRLKFYIKEIREGKRGPEVVVSRSDANLVKGLFAAEVPEINTGAVQVKEVAREAGSRTKIAAISTQQGVDPVGSLVGQKGVRVQAVMNELGEERIDIIAYSDDPGRFVGAALSPAKEVTVTIEEVNGEKIAKVKVPSSQLSLAIGKGGQNVRLAAKLTGHKIDIEGLENERKEKDKAAAEVVVEGVEENIDQATIEEAAVDATEPEPGIDEKTSKKGKEATAVAEEDITADDKELEVKKLAENLGSEEEDKDKQRGDLLATEQPDEQQAPTVANTSETPDVSRAEEPFDDSKVKKADEEEEEKKQGPNASYVTRETEESEESSKKQE